MRKRTVVKKRALCVMTTLMMVLTIIPYATFAAELEQYKEPTTEVPITIVENEEFPGTVENDIEEESNFECNVDLSAPIDIANFYAVGHSFRSVELFWEEVPGVEGYAIYRSKGSEPKDFRLVKEIEGGKTLECIDYIRGKYYYQIATIYNEDGNKVYGEKSKPIAASSIDLSKEDCDYDFPKLLEVEFLNDSTTAPGTIDVRIKATDMESGVYLVQLYAGISCWPGILLGGEQEVDKVVSFAAGVNLEGQVKTFDKIVIADAAHGNYTTAYLKDYCGNKTFTINKEFDFAFEGKLSHPNAAQALMDMDDGDAALLTIDSDSKGVLKKECLDAIKGTNKTLVIYCDNTGRTQWVFRGKNIVGKTKDLKLLVKVKFQEGHQYDINNDIIKLKFADNGDLPGYVTFRMLSKYVGGIYSKSEKMFLYYLEEEDLVLEDEDCEVKKEDANEDWCYIDIDHNSTFVLSGVKKDSIVKNGTFVLADNKYIYDNTIKTPIIKVYDEDNQLVNSKHYSISYAKDRKAVGKYKVSVKFKGDYSGTKTLYFYILPSAPTTVKAELYGYDDAKFSWSKSKGASGYTVYYKKASADDSQYKALGTTTKTYYKKSGLDMATTYDFKVVPYYQDGKKKYFAEDQYAEASVMTLDKLETPEVVQVSLGQVDMSWNDIEGETGYQISVSTSKSKTKTVAKVTDARETVKITRGITNYIKVRAYVTVGKDNIYGPWSTAVTYKEELAAPENIKAKLYGYDDIKVSWDKVAGASGYYVYHKKTTSSKWKELTRTTKTYVNAKNLSAATTYDFKVIPYYKGGSKYYKSKNYEAVTATTMKKLATPSVAKDLEIEGNVVVTWKVTGEADAYEISRSTSKSKTSVVATVSGGEETSASIEGAKKDKKYYYKVRSIKYVDGKPITTPWSKVKAYTWK